MRIYDPLYLSTVSSSSTTRRIPSAMGLYRIEGGCLYRIKIGRYRSRETEEREVGLGAEAAATASAGNSNSGRALGPLTLHEFRDAPLLHSHPLYNPFLRLRPPSSLFFHRAVFFSEFYFPSIPGSVARAPRRRRDNGHRRRAERGGRNTVHGEKEPGPRSPSKMKRAVGWDSRRS